MQLRRLQGLEHEKIDAEYAELQKKNCILSIFIGR